MAIVATAAIVVIVVIVATAATVAIVVIVATAAIVVIVATSWAWLPPMSRRRR